MELERKIELLKRSYMHGFSAFASAIDFAYEYFSDPRCDRTKGEKHVSELYTLFAEIEDHYKKNVPFAEIVDEIKATNWDDFAILFRVREFLPAFRGELDHYIQEVIVNDYHLEKSNPNSQRFDGAINELAKRCEYGGNDLGQIIRKYDPSFQSEPSHSP
jgi:hypothetical protein